METALILTVVSGVVVAALASLFSYENARERRVLPGLRRALDRMVARVSRALDTFADRLSSGTLLYWVQRALQHVVALLLGVVRSLEQFFDRLQRRQVQNVSMRPSAHADEHLRAMRDHKRDTTLSAEERTRIRDEKLEE